jgi:trk system potassium uptake protein TrkA
MKIIVIGYGRVGSQFVKKIDTKANEVVVVDRERAVLGLADLPKEVRVFIGNAIDEGLLRDAGAEKADVMLALTRDENTNLMIAQIGRVLFNIPRVMAVVYEPQRVTYFQEAGIETLAIAVAGADLLAARLMGTFGQAGLTLDAWVSSAPVSAQVPIRPLEAVDGGYYVIIVGGGLVGFYLARTLLQNGHETTIIERNPETYELVSHQIDCPVLVGDGSSAAVLERAGASRANLFCAVTNHDQDNLIACQVAKHRFGIPKTIARVKNPKNEAVMRRLGVDTTVSSTGIITNVIESELPGTPVRTLAALGSCGKEILEFRLSSAAPVVGNPAKRLAQVQNCSVIGLVRKGQAISNLDSLILEAGDTIVAMVEHGREDQVRRMILG